MELRNSDARGALAEALGAVAQGGERVVLTRNGRPVAAIVSPEELLFLERWENQHDALEARRILAERGPFISWEDVKAELKGRPPARRAKPKAKRPGSKAKAGA